VLKVRPAPQALRAQQVQTVQGAPQGRRVPQGAKETRAPQVRWPVHRTQHAMASGLTGWLKDWLKD
jgi:hypothetical protein